MARDPGLTSVCIDKEAIAGSLQLPRSYEHDSLGS
jgi:hypothetical protein